MKKVIVVLIVVLIGFWFFTSSSKPTDVEVASVGDDVVQEVSNEDEEKYVYTFESFDFQFTGYGPAGKQHLGSIDSLIDGNVVTFEMSTVKTDSEQLDEHLCNDDFFICEQYPTSTYRLERLDMMSNGEVLLVGTLDFKDISKPLSFSANILSENEYAGQFLLDTSEFGFKVPIVESEVLISFDFIATKELVEEVVENATTTEDVATTTDLEI